MSENSMMLVEASWQEAKTFRMIPINDECPYVECIFDPTTNVFVVISKIKKTSLHMLPKLDEYGKPIVGSKGHKQERQKIEVFQEFYVEDKKAIEELISIFGINSQSFKYKQFFNNKKVEIPSPEVAE